jgi:hypothetical protein
MLSPGHLRVLLLGLSPHDASFARRGFPECEPGVRRQLERVGRAFIAGYNAGLRHGGGGRGMRALVARLSDVAPVRRGFAFEGAAMALALLDCFTPWRRVERVECFLRGAGAPHAYMVLVGVGWALARLRRRIEPTLARADQLLGWLIADGYGFHEGYFHWPRYVARCARPARLAGYALRAFDQGLGRSLWFWGGADPARIAGAVGRFVPMRQADLWSGVGLACAYAGGADAAAVAALARAAGAFAPHMAQGAAFAAKARERAGNPAAHTELACELLCGTSAAEAAALTETSLKGLPSDGAEPAYEAWRRRIRAHFATLSFTTTGVPS